jgi:hypothetical protein
LSVRLRFLGIRDFQKLRPDPVINELAPVNVEARPYGEQLIGPYGAVCSSIAGIEEVRAIRDPDQVTPGPA